MNNIVVVKNVVVTRGNGEGCCGRRREEEIRRQDMAWETWWRVCGAYHILRNKNITPELRRHVNE